MILLIGLVVLAQGQDASPLVALLLSLKKKKKRLWGRRWVQMPRFYLQGKSFTSSKAVLQISLLFLALPFQFLSALSN